MSQGGHTSVSVLSSQTLGPLRFPLLSQNGGQLPCLLRPVQGFVETAGGRLEVWRRAGNLPPLCKPTVCPSFRVPGLLSRRLRGRSRLQLLPAPRYLLHLSPTISKSCSWPGDEDISGSASAKLRVSQKRDLQGTACVAWWCRETAPPRSSDYSSLLPW